MFDAHSHFQTQEAYYCTSELLPQNYPKTEQKQFQNSKSEIGLDRRFEKIMSMEEQETLLREFLKTADKPISLHCVRATERMINILKEFSFKPKTVLWHGFNGSKETASQLYKLGIIISIGPKFNGNIKEITKANPLFLLETDYEGNDPNEYNEILRRHYEKMAKELNLTVKELEEHCNDTGLAFKNPSIIWSATTE